MKLINLYEMWDDGTYTVETDMKDEDGILITVDFYIKLIYKEERHFYRLSPTEYSRHFISLEIEVEKSPFTPQENKILEEQLIDHIEEQIERW